MTNGGLEASLDPTLLRAPGWSWGVVLSGSVNDNEVLDLGPGVESIGCTRIESILGCRSGVHRSGGVNMKSQRGQMPPLAFRTGTTGLSFARLQLEPVGFLHPPGVMPSLQ